MDACTWWMAGGSVVTTTSITSRNRRSIINPAITTSWGGPNVLAHKPTRTSRTTTSTAGTTHAHDTYWSAPPLGWRLEDQLWRLGRRKLACDPLWRLFWFSFFSNLSKETVLYFVFISVWNSSRKRPWRDGAAGKEYEEWKRQEQRARPDLKRDCWSYLLPQPGLF